MNIQLYNFPNLKYNSAFLWLHLFCCNWNIYSQGNQYWIMALTHLLWIYLSGLFHEWGKSPDLFMEYSSLHMISVLRMAFVWDVIQLHRSQCHHTFITSAPALNLWEQTAAYCSGGDRVKISNLLNPHRDNSANITVIHHKKCLTGRFFSSLCVFHQA